MGFKAGICGGKVLAAMLLATTGPAALASAASAQQAQDRAGALKAWREQCNDPDPDLRQAYVQEAIASGDVAVQRICVRLALESDNADIRNLGLRAAIASTPRIFFTVTMPPWLEEEYKKAGTNEKRLKEMSNWYVVKDNNSLKNGLSFEVDGIDVTSSTSNWYPLVSLTERNDRYKGTAVITGSSITWHGSAALSRHDCSMTLQVGSGAEISGTLQCADLPAFPVSAKLL